MRVRPSLLKGVVLVFGAWTSSTLGQGCCPYCPPPSVAASIVVPYAAGGRSDILARGIASRINTICGRSSFVIDNKAGAGGTVGASAVAKAAPNGATLLLGGMSTHTIAPVVSSKLSYDPVRDFVSGGLIAEEPLVLVVPSNNPAKNVRELLSIARGQPLSFASEGAATPGHVAVELFKQGTGAAVTHIPYRGSSPAIQDVAAGQVAGAFTSPSVAAPMIREGKLKALAIQGERRSDLLPDVPTFSESGFSNVSPTYGWYGLFFPKDTDSKIVDGMAANVKALQGDPEFSRLLKDMGLVVPRQGSRNEVDGRLVRDRAQVQRLPAIKAEQ